MIKSLSPHPSFVAIGIALLLVLHTRNNTDGKKLMIFSGIALYYGDTYILTTGRMCRFLDRID